CRFRDSLQPAFLCIPATSPAGGNRPRPESLYRPHQADDRGAVGVREGCFQVAGHTCLTAVRQFPGIRVAAPVLLSPVTYASHIDSRWGCCNGRISYTVPNNTRQG